MLIIIVFRLGSDVSCFFYGLSPPDQSRDVTPRLGRVNRFSFSIVQDHFVMNFIMLFIIIIIIKKCLQCKAGRE